LSDKANRKKLINKFQELIWEDESSSELLSNLAYDLDFYEPSEDWQKESPSYYGDQRLEKEIMLVLKQLNDFNSESG
jgi:hypothetical protein